ncbi:MAG: hypothetical protein RR728_07965 [Oscillospiraceae bacterium]
MVSWYIQKGFSPEYLLALCNTDKLFFLASMEVEKERLRKMGGMQL